MTSKTSYNSISKYMMQQLRQTRSFILLLAVVYLTIGPVMLTIQMSGMENVMNPLPLLQTLFSGYYVSYFIAAMVLGTLGALYITRYQNVQTQSNFYHSLPVSRGHLLTGRILALVLVQAFLLVVVTVANMVASVLFARSVGESGLVGPLMASAGIHFVEIMLIFLLAMAIALFAGQLTANTLGQILMTGVLHGTVLLFSGVVGMTMDAFSETYYGATGLVGRLAKFNILSPVLNDSAVYDALQGVNPLLSEPSMSQSLNIGLLIWPTSTVAICAGITVVLLLATYVLYKHRAVEKAGDTLMYGWVGGLVKALYVLCGSIFGGLAFYGMTGQSLVAFIVGALIAAVIVHIVAEMIFSQDVNGIRHHFVSTLVPFGVVLAVISLFHTGVVDMDDHMPKEGSVQAAAIVLSDGSNDGQALNSATAKDPDVIKKVIAAMEKANENRLSQDEIMAPAPSPRAATRGEDAEVVQQPMCNLEVSYKTRFFGNTVRYYTVPPDVATEIMAPFFDDKKYYDLVWSSMAGIRLEDVSELTLNPSGFEGFSTVDNSLRLIEDESAYAGEDGKVSIGKKDRETRLARSEALLNAIKKDIKHRNKAVLQSRPLGHVYYSTAILTPNGKKEMVWGMSYTLYEGDKATAALLKEWRDAGILQDERAQLLENMAGFTVKTVNYEDNDAAYTVTGTMSNEEFVDRWLKGDFIYTDQVERYGFKVDTATGVIVTDAQNEDVAVQSDINDAPANPDAVSYATFYYNKK